jgi:RNase H-fold protein (predicted Holliday junction resolvase)
MGLGTDEFVTTMAIDYGLRRVGVAVSVGFAPRALPIVFNRGNLTALSMELLKIAWQENAFNIVIGLPLSKCVHSTHREGD